MTKARLGKQIGDVNWNYFEFGDGRPIFLLHGMQNSAELIVKLSIDLADKGFHVITPDLPGFGSTKSLKYNSYKNIAIELTKFIKSFEFDQVDIYGHSLGGTLALMIGNLNRDITNTVYSSSPYWRKGGIELSLIEKAQLGITTLPTIFNTKLLSPGIVKFLLKIAGMLNPQLNKTVKNNCDSIVNSLLSIDLKGAKEVFNSLGNDPLENNLNPPYPRTLIMWAMDDKLIPYKEVKALMEKIRSPMVKIKGENHGIIVDNPEIISEIIHNYSFRGNILENDKVEVERP